MAKGDFNAQLEKLKPLLSGSRSKPSWPRRSRLPPISAVG